MRRLKVVLIPFLLLGLFTSLIGCSGGGETTSPQGREIEHFLNDPHVNAVLWEEWNIFDEISASDSLSNSAKRWEYRCALRERAIENREELNSITPPSALAEFWTMLAGTEPFDLNNSKTGGALGYYFWGSRICAGSRGGDFDEWLRKQGVDKNTEAWFKFKAVCRVYGVEVPWYRP